MHELLAFAAAPRATRRTLTVVAARVKPAVVRIDYRLAGDLESVVVPAAGAAVFADQLWEHTCFELFVTADLAGSYLELNFSPSGAWAAYAFGSYRRGMRALRGAQAPAVIVTRGDDQLRLLATVDLAGLPIDAATLVWRAGVSAVVELADGAREYWALAHPAERPDFHDPASFTLTLEAPPATMGR